MNKKKVIITIVVVAVIGLLVGSLIYVSTPVSNSNKIIIFTVNKKDSKQVIVSNLKKENLIKSKYYTLALILLSGKTNLQAGTYELSKDMSPSEIINMIAEGKVKTEEKEAVRITFSEGLTLKEFMMLLSEKTDLDYETIIKEVNNKELLQKIIKDYWFLSDSILNKDIYYALEGYLFPLTYDFYLDTSLEKALRVMLNQTDKVLSKYKDKINASKKSVHEILTMASIIEKEGKSYEDRIKISQVIYKRLNINMNLGMDVTTYYGAQKTFKEKVDFSASNPYNTRRLDFIGLPVGPICNPGEASIKAALNPSDTNYIYFFAEFNGTVHFTDSYSEFEEFKKIYKW